MINLNANVNSVLGSRGTEVPKPRKLLPPAKNAATEKTDFTNTIKAVSQYISKVDDLQHCSDMSIADLLAGKNTDINSVVSAVAKADMSFKLLVGVRNKLIEAYKQTMNMPL
ncbi:MAG: flagellar hook-basal body complex protein FliE [Sedimentisphaerales bacterium]